MAKKSAQSMHSVAVAPAQTLKPGDEAAPGTPGTGENVCPACNGRGQINGRMCTHCSGTGKITTGIGGA